MKTCPLLWRQASSGRVGLLKKNVDLDGKRSKASEPIQDEGYLKECLGAVCRFYTAEDACGLEEQRESLAILEKRVRESDERWESILLSLVELTERFEGVLTRIGEQHSNSERETDAEEPVMETEAEPEPEPEPDPEPVEDQTTCEVTDADLEAAQELNSEGITHYHDEELQQAHECFQQAVELTPYFVEAYNNLGLVETEQGEIETAVMRFEQAIDLDPDLSASYTNLGYVHYLQESYLEAISMYEAALERAENSSSAWTNLGNAHFKLGNLEQARQAWENAVTLDPSNTKAAQNLSQIPQEEGITEDEPVPQEDPA
jgi:tetratricopeptide (TPR) repeat protein